MSILSVTTIKTGDAETPLSFTTGNTSSGSIKVEAANNDVIFFGTAKITGALTANGVDISGIPERVNRAHNQANIAFVQANIAFVQANIAFVQANTARDHANTAHASANAGLLQANTARDHANNAYATSNLAFTHANNAYSTANNAASTGKAIAMAIVFG